MPTLTSADGTTIAYEIRGAGPVVICVDGAMCFQASGPMRPLADVIAADATVVTYDRRGRGGSSDTVPYAIEREVEDLRALVTAAGGTAVLYAMSSGVALALHTAAVDAGIGGIVAYEPPYLAGQGNRERAAEYTAGLNEALADGRRGDAIALFMRFVGLPDAMIAGLECQPAWAVFTSIAPTLAYDDALLAGGELPVDLAPAVSVPVLVVSGGDSPPMLRHAAEALATMLPAGEHASLPGQTHDVHAAAIAPVVAGFARTERSGAGSAGRR